MLNHGNDIVAVLNQLSKRNHKWIGGILFVHGLIDLVEHRSEDVPD